MRFQIKDNSLISADKDGLDFLKMVLDGNSESVFNLTKMISLYEIENTVFCQNCRHGFFSTNTNATYCEFCKKNMGKIRYQARKKNVERKLHQEILSMLYRLDDTKESSNAFLNESNYYWDIVSGKGVEKNPAYKKRIKTKEDYMKWLQEQKKAYKKRV